MFSIRSFTLLATAALATFASAAPLAVRDNSIVDSVAVLPISGNSITAPVAANAASVGSVANARRDGESIPDIVVALIGDVKGLVSEVENLLKAEIIDAVAVVGVVGQIENVVLTAVAAVGALATSTVAEVLLLAGEVITVAQLATILASLISLVIQVLGTVSTLIGVVEKDALLPLIASIGGALVRLLTIVLALVPGLLAALAPLIGEVVGIIKLLGLTSLLTILGL